MVCTCHMHPPTPNPKHNTTNHPPPPQKKKNNPPLPNTTQKYTQTNQAILANLAIGLVNYLSTFLALYLVDRAGRRLLLILGGLGMGLFTGLFALFTSSAFDYEVCAMCVYVYVCVYVCVCVIQDHCCNVKSKHHPPTHPPTTQPTIPIHDHSTTGCWFPHHTYNLHIPQNNHPSDPLHNKTLAGVMPTEIYNTKTHNIVPIYHNSQHCSIYICAKTHNIVTIAAR
jgi:hypothetical protein